MEAMEGESVSYNPELTGEEADDDEKDVSAQVDQFFNELDLELAQRRKALKSLTKVGGAKSTRTGILPHHLKSVMGQANLRVARGDLEEAIKICMEIIRQAPDVPEPFLTLEMIYEEMEDEEKRFQFALIAAHLQPRDVDQWLKTAHLAVDRGELKTALTCYSKVLGLNPSNLEVLWKKASLQVDVGEYGKAVESYQKIMEHLPESQANEYLRAAMETAKIHNDVDHIDKAVEVLKAAFSKYPQHVDETAVNMLAELYLIVKDYWGALETVTNFYKIAIPQSIANRGKSDEAALQAFTEAAQSMSTASTPPSSHEPSIVEQHTPSVSIASALEWSMGVSQSPSTSSQPQAVEDPTVKFVEELAVPAQAPLDLKAKVAVCLIHIFCTAPKCLLSAIYEADPEKCGDIFLDVAEAFMDVGLHSRALPLLSILVETLNYGQPGVWLKHAECLHSLDDLESAAVSYGHVVAMAPHHTEARLTLATIYSQLGRTDDALLVLGGDETGEEEDQEESVLSQLPSVVDVNQLPPTVQNLKVTYHRSCILLAEKRLMEYSDLVLDMLYFLFRDVIHHRDLKFLAHMSLKMKKKRIAEADPHSEEMKQQLLEKEKMLALEEWWDVFSKGCDVLFSLERKDELLFIVFAANASAKFAPLPRERMYDLLAIAISSCALLGDWKEALTFARAFIATELSKPGSIANSVWNYFNIIPFTNVNVHRFLVRLLVKDPSSIPLLLLCANHYLGAGSYRTALNLYHHVLKRDPSQYLSHLCMGMVFLALLQQRKKGNPNVYKGGLALQALGCFVRYFRARGKCQESLYNVARAFHQLGQLNYASNLYKQVLTCPSESDDPCSDLRKEAGYNLAHIYKSSGNLALARHIMWTYCSV
jgi:general transcription factor 3C polypeptide 3 (transcription factor C subunit 4)